MKVLLELTNSCNTMMIFDGTNVHAERSGAGFCQSSMYDNVMTNRWIQMVYPKACSSGNWFRERIQSSSSPYLKNTSTSPIPHRHPYPPPHKKGKQNNNKRRKEAHVSIPNTPSISKSIYPSMSYVIHLPIYIGVV